MGGIWSMSRQTEAATHSSRKRIVTTLCLIGALVGIQACSNRNEDRLAFDGQLFRSSASHIDRNQRDVFEVRVRPFSASAEGALEAGRYEGTQYCIERYGTSDIDWSVGPESDDAALVIDGDTLVLTGTCAP